MLCMRLSRFRPLLDGRRGLTLIFRGVVDAFLGQCHVHNDPRFRCERSPRCEDLESCSMISDARVKNSSMQGISSKMRHDDDEMVVEHFNVQETCCQAWTSRRSRCWSLFLCSMTRISTRASRCRRGQVACSSTGSCRCAAGGQLGHRAVRLADDSRCLLQMRSPREMRCS